MEIISKITKVLKDWKIVDRDEDTDFITVKYVKENYYIDLLISRSSNINGKFILAEIDPFKARKFPKREKWFTIQEFNSEVKAIEIAEIFQDNFADKFLYTFNRYDNDGVLQYTISVIAKDFNKLKSICKEKPDKWVEEMSDESRWSKTPLPGLCMRSEVVNYA